MVEPIAIAAIGSALVTTATAVSALALSSDRKSPRYYIPAVKQQTIDRGLKTACGHIVNFFDDHKIPIRINKASRGYQVINIECRVPAIMNTKKIVATRQDLEHFLLAKGISIVPNSLRLEIAGILTISWSTKASSAVYLSKVYRLYYNGKRITSGIFPIGLKMDGSPFCISLNEQESPHALLAGATGSGKTVCAMDIIIGALSMEWDVKILNPKIEPPKRSLGLWDFKEHRGVTYINRYDDMANTVNRLASSLDMVDRPTLIVADELADMVETMKGNIATPLGKIAQKGREYDVHLVGITPKLTKSVLFDDMLHANAGTTVVGFRMNTKFLSQYGTGMGGMDLDRLSGNGHCKARTGSEITEAQIALPDNIDRFRDSGIESTERQSELIPIVERWFNSVPVGGSVSKDALRNYASAHGNGIGYNTVKEQYDLLVDQGRIDAGSKFQAGQRIA